LIRLESLVASRAASSVEADQARNTLDAARVALRQAELELARRTVTAPISGSLGILAVNAGDYVTSQTEIASIDDRSEILIEFFVPERFASGMEVGKQVVATAISRPGERFTGPFRRSTTVSTKPVAPCGCAPRSPIPMTRCAQACRSR
jgi:multidrug resistance efflux pump